jgi:hypothetical protein
VNGELHCLVCQEIVDRPAHGGQFFPIGRIKFIYRGCLFFGDVTDVDG